MLKSSVYRLESIPNKGYGLIATQSIEAGTCLISEPPLFTTESLTNPSTIEQDLGSIVRSLPRDQQRAFLSLHNNFPGRGSPFSSIVRSNGYPLGPGSEIGGIFLETSRANHACKSNAQHAYNEKKGRMQVHAIRHIEAGEEITLCYLQAGMLRDERQNYLREYFGFECQCEMCSAREESEDWVRKARELDEKIGDSKRVHLYPDLALRDCRELLDIYEEEGITDLRLSRLYYDAFQVCALHSDLARASIFARLAKESRRICEGEDSEELAGLERDPRGYENWGIDKKWQSKIRDIPKGLSREESHRWLWRER